VPQRTEEQFEVSRFPLGLNGSPGFDRADKYTLEECLNLDVDDHGAIVTRKGCRRVAAPVNLTNIHNLLVTDVQGVPTIVVSGIHTTDGGAVGAYAIRMYSMVGGGLGTGDYVGGQGLYSRAASLTNDTPRSTDGWDFVYFRGFLYVCTGNQSHLDTGASTNPKAHNGMFRWNWHEKPNAVQSTPLEDWKPDGLAALLTQDESLTRPTIVAGGVTLPDQQSHGNYDLHRLLSPTQAHGPKTSEERREVILRNRPVLFSGTPAFSGTLTEGNYYYIISYVRSATLGESVGYALNAFVNEDGMTITIENVPTHPDPSVDTIRVYRNISPTEIELRFMMEMPNGTSTIYDDGLDVSISAETYTPQSTMPTAGRLTVHQGRIYCAGSTQAGNVVYYTENGGPENTAAGDGIVIGPYPGPRIVGLASTGLWSEQETYSGPLLIFTASATYALVGEPPDLVLRPRSEQVGCQAAETIASYEHRVFWLGNNGVYASDGGTPRRISEGGSGEEAWSVGSIDARLAGVNANALSKACGAVANIRYYLSVEDSNGDQRVFVFDMKKRLWTERSYPFTISSFSTYQTHDGGEELYASTSTGEIFQLEVGAQDEDVSGTATAISWNAKLNANWFGNKGQTKRFRRFRIVTDRSREMTLKTYVGSPVAKQTKVLERPDRARWGDGSKWGDGTLWVTRAERVIREGLNDTNVGVNVQADVSGSGPGRVESVAIDITRLRQ